MVAVISWMVGLLYLPRLYVYHNDKKYLSDSDTTFLLMERRLLKYIMNPALVLVWFSGLYLGHILGFDTWLIIKVGLVFILTAYHIFCRTRGLYFQQLTLQQMDIRGIFQIWKLYYKTITKQ